MSQASTPLAQPAAPSERRSGPTPPAGRLASIDALRGFDMIWILGLDTLLQAVARLYPNAFTKLLSAQFDHVQWGGLHAYDVIYPLFIFLAGVSIVFALDKARATQPKRTIVARILRRGLLIYLLNFIFNGGFTRRWPDMRVASGVLALIAAAYVIAALIYCFCADRPKLMAGITAALLVGYWALLALAPFPDFHLDAKTIDALAQRAGSSSPAAVAAMVPERISGVYEEGRNFSNYVDYRFMPGRMLNRYFESQGLLSPISAAAVCLLGVFAGRLLKREGLDPKRRVRWLALGGVAAIALGLLWSLEFPIVKKLWSSSFCLVTAGIGALLLAVFYLVIDVWQRRRWCTPFLWIGTNPIVLYVLSGVVGFGRLAEYLAGGDVKAFLDRRLPGLGAVLVALVALGLVLSFARFLYRRGIFLRV